MTNYECVIATKKLIIKKWDEEILKHNNSELWKMILKKRCFNYLPLGVEPCEIRNIQIYFKLGFTKYIKTEYEYYLSDEKALVNYYEKGLI